MSRAPAVLPALVATVGACLVAAACSGPEAAENRGPKMVRTTEGDVTTVDNRWGSAWDGRARLEEESVIGVLEGDEPYMLGPVRGLAADDERTYVLDTSVPVVRVYDAAGRYLNDIGQSGQGPGEYEHPGGLVLDDRGRLLVSDPGAMKVLVYDSSGEYLETWRWEGSVIVFNNPAILAREGGAWIPFVQLGDSGDYTDFTFGYQAVGPDADSDDFRPAPEPEVEEETATVPQGDRQMQVPGLVSYIPRHRTTFTSDGAFYAGDGATYRLVRSRRGARELVITRHWEPVPVSDDERDDAIAVAEANIRSRFDIADWRYNGPEPGARRAAFGEMLADVDARRLWVARDGPGYQLDGCDPVEALERLESCWRSEVFWDVFDETGEYLGALTPPPGAALQWSYLRGDLVVTPSVDEDGLVRVHRLHLVARESGA